jgi:hypothetical protein
MFLKYRRRLNKTFQHSAEYWNVPQPIPYGLIRANKGNEVYLLTTC